MDDIAVATVWFIIAFFCHMVLYRIFFRWKFILFALSGLYFLGIPIVLFKQIFFPQSGIHLVITSCVLSFVYSSIMVLFYSSRLLKGHGPSTVMFHAFSHKPFWKKKELEALFTESGLVGKRLATLIEHNLIYRKDKKLFVTQKGAILFRCIRAFLHVSGVEVEG